MFSGVLRNVRRQSYRDSEKRVSCLNKHYAASNLDRPTKSWPSERKSEELYTAAPQVTDLNQITFELPV